MIDFNFLAVEVSTYSGFGMPFQLDWLGSIIQWIIEGFGSIGLGIIIFSLCLKILPLPLDIISKVSMKKNAIKMEQLRPQLERLQKQYANNKQLYNQKVMALQKKAGYSPFSACLPTIITLVLFIVVINQFSNYSRYTNLTMINGMSETYTETVEALGEQEEHIIFVEVNGERKSYFLNQKEIFNNEAFAEMKQNGFEIVTNEQNTSLKEYEATYISNDLQKLGAYVKKLNGEGFDAIAVGTDAATCAILENEGVFSYNKQFFKNGADFITDEAVLNARISTSVGEFICEKFLTDNVKMPARQAAANYFRENVPSFLWVKNLWVSDVSYQHPVKSTISEYDFAKDLTVKDEDQYNEVTFLLEEEKNQPNGYFVLVILSIGVMFASQFIMRKMQKSQMELQSVDGQAAQTSKIMTWLLPIMFGVFAFIYTASFSLYMIISSIFSTVSSLVINKLVEIKFRKKLDEARNDRGFKK